MSVTSNLHGIDGGLEVLAPEREAAWVGILQAHAELTRALDTALAAGHGLSFGAYEVLAGTVRSEDGHRRMSELAETSQLSLSRVSRIVDLLEQRGLVERRSCTGDSRVVHVAVTDAGRAVAAAAQETFFEVVEERFLGRLAEEDVRRLGAILSRLVTAPLHCPSARQ